MKHILVVLFILYTTLDASPYIRSIRLGSFVSEKAAQKTLANAKEIKRFYYYKKKITLNLKLLNQINII